MPGDDPSSDYSSGAEDSSPAGHDSSTSLDGAVPEESPQVPAVGFPASVVTGQDKPDTPTNLTESDGNRTVPPTRPVRLDININNIASETAISNSSPQCPSQYFGSPKMSVPPHNNMMPQSRPYVRGREYETMDEPVQQRNYMMSISAHLNSLNEMAAMNINGMHPGYNQGRINPFQPPGQFPGTPYPHMMVTSQAPGPHPYLSRMVMPTNASSGIMANPNLNAPDPAANSAANPQESTEPPEDPVSLPKVIHTPGIPPVSAFIELAHPTFDVSSCVSASKNEVDEPPGVVDGDGIKLSKISQLAAREIRLAALQQQCFRILRCLNVCFAVWGAHQGSFLWHCGYLLGSETLRDVAAYSIILEDCWIEVQAGYEQAALNAEHQQAKSSADPKPSTAVRSESPAESSSGSSPPILPPVEPPTSHVLSGGLLTSLMYQCDSVTLINAILQLDNFRCRIEAEFTPLKDFTDLLATFSAAQAIHASQQSPSLFVNGEIKRFKNDLSSKSGKRRAHDPKRTNRRLPRWPENEPTEGVCKKRNVEGSDASSLPVVVRPESNGSSPAAGFGDYIKIETDNINSLPEAVEPGDETSKVSNGPQSPDAATPAGFSENGSPSENSSMISPNGDILDLPRDPNSFRSKVKGVYYDDTSNRWCASWHERKTGKKRSRYFAVKKFGFTQAKTHAMDARLEAEESGECAPTNIN